MSYALTSQNIDFSTLIDGLSKDELQDLMSNEDKVNEIISDQDQVRKIKLDIELIQAGNRSLADYNIGKEPELNSLRENLASKYEKLKELNDSFQMNQATLASLQKDINLEAMLAVLQTSCAVSEEQSEELAERFLNGDADVNEFLTEFKAKKTEAHTKRLKTEKMRELIIKQRQQDSASSASNYASRQPPPPQQQPQPAVPSYPGGYGAPQARPPFNQQRQASTYQNYQSYQWG